MVMLARKPPPAVVDLSGASSHPRRRSLPTSGKHCLLPSFPFVIWSSNRLTSTVFVLFETIVKLLLFVVVTVVLCGLHVVPGIQSGLGVVVVSSIVVIDIEYMTPEKTISHAMLLFARQVGALNVHVALEPHLNVVWR